MPKVLELMDRGSIPVAPGDSIKLVAKRMLVSRSNVVPVCEGSRFCGIITDRDITTFVGTVAGDSIAENAGKIMNSRVPVISPELDVWQAANLMVETTSWTLPVVEKGNFIGMFTLQNFAGESPALAAMVFARTAQRESIRNKAVTTARAVEI